MKRFRCSLPTLGALSFIAAACGSTSEAPNGSAGTSSGALGGSGGSGIGTSGHGGSSAGAPTGTGGSGGSGGSGIGTGGSTGGNAVTAGSGAGGTSAGSAGMPGGAGSNAATGGKADMPGAGRGGNGNMAGRGNGGMPGTGGGAGSGMAGSGTAGASGSAGAGATETVCGVLADGGNTCAAAHSTTRVLYPGYNGPLYQVCKGTPGTGPKSCTSGMSKDIGAVGGYADAASQDTFCGGGTCTISIIYDQTPNGNDLKVAPAGGTVKSPDKPANAADLKTTLDGHTVYGVLIKPGMGYRAGCKGCDAAKATGTATGDQAETEYMVTSQKDLVDSCCFDYGNAETSGNDDGNGTMEALYFGGGVSWGTGSPGGHNNGPWVMADLENGLYAGWENNQDQNISTNTPLKFDFVTAVLIGDVAAQNSNKGRFAMYGGDATSGTLKTMYDGVRPNKSGYSPMKKQGSIILGIGGDNSDSAGGRWYEGVMASGAASSATLSALQSNIVAAKYGK